MSKNPGRSRGPCPLEVQSWPVARPTPKGALRVRSRDLQIAGRWSPLGILPGIHMIQAKSGRGSSGGGGELAPPYTSLTFFDQLSPSAERQTDFQYAWSGATIRGTSQWIRHSGRWGASWWCRRWRRRKKRRGAPLRIIIVRRTGKTKPPVQLGVGENT